jgi:hypothetical protein
MSETGKSSGKVETLNRSLIDQIVERERTLPGLDAERAIFSNFAHGCILPRLLSRLGGLPDALTSIGTDPVAQAAGFYAIAYEVGAGVDGLEPGTKVISYRGTDNFANASIAAPSA